MKCMSEQQISYIRLLDWESFYVNKDSNILFSTTYIDFGVHVGHIVSCKPNIFYNHIPILDISCFHIVKCSSCCCCQRCFASFVFSFLNHTSHHF